VEKKDIDPICFQPTQGPFRTRAEISSRERSQRILPKAKSARKGTRYSQRRGNRRESLYHEVGGNSVFGRYYETIAPTV
jgi:hypothetical protein